MRGTQFRYMAHQYGGDRIARGDPNRAGRTQILAGQLSFQRQEVLREPSRETRYSLAGRRRRIAISEALEQPDTETLLDHAQAPEYGRVCHAQAPRSARE